LESLKAIRLLIAAALLGLIICPQNQAASASAARASNEIWIAARTDGMAGTGTSTTPTTVQRRASSIPSWRHSASRIIILVGDICDARFIPKSAGGFIFHQGPLCDWMCCLRFLVSNGPFSVPALPNRFRTFGLKEVCGTAICKNQKIPNGRAGRRVYRWRRQRKIGGLKAINWGSTREGAEAFVVSVFM